MILNDRDSRRDPLQTFRRNQVEHALWKFATFDRQAHHEPNSAFKARVKHLLNLNQSGIIFQRDKNAPKVARPLGDSSPAGTGTDAEFTVTDTVCLGLALDMLRAGFKQQEVLLLLGYLRRPLEETIIPEVLRSPPEFVPVWPKKKIQSVEQDRRVFLVLHRVESSEEFAAFNPKRQSVPIYKEPRICKGVSELSAVLADMNHVLWRAIVFEIGYLVAGISQFLSEVPPAKRGRRK
jgi:hypothetical protein